MDHPQAGRLGLTLASGRPSAGFPLVDADSNSPSSPRAPVDCHRSGPHDPRADSPRNGKERQRRNPSPGAIVNEVNSSPGRFATILCLKGRGSLPGGPFPKVGQASKPARFWNALRPLTSGAALFPDERERPSHEGVRGSEETNRSPPVSVVVGWYHRRSRDDERVQSPAPSPTSIPRTLPCPIPTGFHRRRYRVERSAPRSPRRSAQPAETRCHSVPRTQPEPGRRERRLGSPRSTRFAGSSCC
jgi:hypothetical protein